MIDEETGTVYTIKRKADRIPAKMLMYDKEASNRD